MTIKLAHGYIKLKKLKYSGWYLETIVVEKGFQNQGIGKHLMEKALNKCAPPIYLLVTNELNSDVERLIDFYKSFGFEKIRDMHDISYNYNMALC